ncbi:MAG: transposase family protein, partial [Chloroflexota bacterium]|nr:transposase family protein [Chloroflexota bacterium]
EYKVSMTLMNRRGLIRAVSARYALAGRQLKTKILDEFTANTGYGRKYAIAVLRKPPVATAPKARRRRRHTYPSSLIEVLVLAWRTCECICSKRFKPFLPEMARQLEAFGHVRLTDEERALLARMSTSTIDRLLKPFRDAARPRGKSTTRPGPGLRRFIPVCTFAERSPTHPGTLEIDLVAHCGEKTAGDYVVTLNTVDLATFWSECIVPANRGQHAVLAAIQKIRARLPFPLRAIDSDNDSSFINHMLLRYCQQEKIGFTRSRPYKKNDQAHVEERNRYVVRQVVGYDRYENDAVPALNALWERYRLFTNFYQPVMKLTSKTRIDGHLKKAYDEAATPYQRVLASPEVLPENKATLTALYATLDPVALRLQIEKLQRHVWENRRVRFLNDATTPPKYDS